MIGKLIRMNRRRRLAAISRSRRNNLRRLRQVVFALTRYIVDADPYSLIEATERDILSITDYALAAKGEGIEPGEKVAAFGSRNLVSDDLAVWQAQMLAVAARAPKIRSPVVHIILSLREEEEWNAVDREEAIDIVLATLGLESCPVVWAEHSNTRNPHLHLSVVRVDPESGKAAGSDWLIDDLHQALALIEEKQGRTREPGALYIAREGAVFDSETGAMVRDAGGRYVAGWYKALGKKHDRVPAELLHCRAELLNASMEAQSWAELHEAFADLNFQYDRSGSGARITHGAKSVKASAIHSSLARGDLEKRLGAFEPDIHRLDAEYEAFRYALDAQLKELRTRRGQECARIDVWADATIAGLPKTARMAVRKAVQAETREAKKALQQAFAEAIKQCTSQRLTLEQWRAQDRPDYRRVTTPAVLIPRDVDDFERPAPPDHTFPHRNSAWATTYLDEFGNRLFTDHRVIIIVHRVDHIAAIDEALQLAAARWGNVLIDGPDAFIELAAARAARFGISVVRPSGASLERTDNAAPTAERPLAPPKKESESGPAEDPIDRAIHLLSQYPALALRRREEPGDTLETGRTGPLELLLRSKSSGTEQPSAVFDSDSRLQDFLAKRRSEILKEVQCSLLNSDLERCPTSAPETLKALDCDEKLTRVIAAMAHDHDFLEMLREVRTQMLQRQPMVDRKIAASPDVQANVTVADGNVEGQGDYSLAQLQYYQNKGRKARE